MIIHAMIKWQVFFFINFCCATPITYTINLYPYDYDYICMYQTILSWLLWKRHASRNWILQISSLFFYGHEDVIAFLNYSSLIYKRIKLIKAFPIAFSKLIMIWIIAKASGIDAWCITKSFLPDAHSRISYKSLVYTCVKNDLE